MRTALYAYLVANCQRVHSWHQPYTPEVTTTKPYGVIVFGEVYRSPANRRGSFRSLYIWPYLEPGSYVDLDDAVAEIKGLLGERNGQPKSLTTADGKRFELEWVSEGRDFHDPDLDAITRRLEYRVPVIW